MVWCKRYLDILKHLEFNEQTDRWTDRLTDIRVANAALNYVAQSIKRTDRQ